MKVKAAPKSQPIRLKKTPENRRQIFWACSGAAIALVAAGWFLSMRDAILSMSADVPAVSELGAIREQLESVTGDLVENTAAPRAGFQELLVPAAEDLQQTVQEGVDQREAAANVIGDVFLENLPDPSAAAAEPVQADAGSSDATAPLEP